MMQIRSSVFETNSSSTHCVCIATDRNAELDFPEVLKFNCKEYGRYKDELRTPESKASYLYASILSIYERKKAEKAKNWIMDKLAEVGVECVFETPVYNSYWGGFYCTNAYVDHPGEDDHATFVENILRSKGRLIRYLFSDKSFVITTSDEIEDDSIENFHVDYRHEFYYKGN